MVRSRTKKWLISLALTLVMALVYFYGQHTVYQNEFRYLERVVLDTVRRSSAAHYGHAYVDEIQGVYDGDTFRVMIRGWPPLIGEAMPVRILGVDTPEIKGDCAREIRLAEQAKAFLENALTHAKQVELRGMQRDKYFRILADVYVDGTSLASAMIAAQVARPYTGGTRGTWCDK